MRNSFRRSALAALAVAFLAGAAFAANDTAPGGTAAGALKDLPKGSSPVNNPNKPSKAGLCKKAHEACHEKCKPLVNKAGYSQCTARCDAEYKQCLVK